MKIDFSKIFTEYYTDISSMLPNIITGILVIIFFIILGENPRGFSIQFVFAKLVAETRNEIIHKHVVHNLRK